MDEVGFLGTHALLRSDLVLVIYVLVLLPAMVIGFVFARRKMFIPHHKWVMTLVLIVNWILIGVLMIGSYNEHIAPNVSHSLSEPFVLIPTIHLISGAVAQILGTYLIVLMWTEKTRFRWILPEFLHTRRIKPLMRITLVLWLTTIVLGLGIYLVWYTPAAVEIIEIDPTGETGVVDGELVEEVGHILGIGGTQEHGSFLISADGFTLYTHANDEPGWSNCVDECAETWIPLTVEADMELILPPELLGVVGTTERADGTLQLTYNDRPLYLHIEDDEPGDVLGHEIDGLWFVAPALPENDE